jgi:GLPGLI family protein
MQKQIVGTNFVVEDSIPNIQWKITNEHREIGLQLPKSRR